MMKFYRVSYHREGGCSNGYSWHTNKRDAERLARAAVDNDPDEYGSFLGPPEIEQIEIKPTRRGMQRAAEIAEDYGEVGLSIIIHRAALGPKEER